MHHVISNILKSLDDGLGALLLSVVLLDPNARHVLLEFRKAGALTPDSAQPFHPRSPTELRAFEQLLKRAIIREPRPGKYFLDERTLRHSGST